MKKGDILTVTIESLAFGGSGIARVPVDDGSFVVFVEDTVPGDTVEIELGSQKRNHAFGYVRHIVQASPLRIEGRCKHFGSVRDGGCGGCSLQFLSYEQQLLIKEQQVRDAMIRLGGFDGLVVKQIIGCREPWFYRNKMEFSFGRNKQGQLGLGLHLKRMHHDVVPLSECFLFAPWAGDFVSLIRKFFVTMDEERLIDTDLRLVSLVVREGKNTGEIMVNLIAENGEANFLNDFTAVVRDFFRSQVESSVTAPRKLVSLYFTHIKNKKGTRKSISETVLWGEPVIHEILYLDDGQLSYEIHPQAFFQPNTKQAQILYGEAVKAAGLSGQETVFDLFCGTGTIGMFCSSMAKKVIGIELNEKAVENARSNAEHNRVKNIEFLCGDVVRTLPEVGERPDVVVLDPPRAGLHADTVKHVASFGPTKIVYVSCNPTTLARDLKLFCDLGYSLQSVQPVDMFPQTYHIENVALLLKHL